jgi:hypothetical protein
MTVTLKSCPYRKQRSAENGFDTDIVCVAGDNHRLGMAAVDAGWIGRICGKCPIPDAFAESAKPCLYMLPMRFFADDEVKTLYQSHFLWDKSAARGKIRRTACPGSLFNVVSASGEMSPPRNRVAHPSREKTLSRRN